MKRRNGECPKLRRPVKRNKITDGIYGSTIVYMKFFMLWALVLLADFLLEFRFEFLWPFWLLLRSVYDSYKYQGLAFSVFFVSIALTSDMICYFFIPVQWLFFAASTYVWVQYVWHTEKGICLPTVLLWVLFAYMEVAVRLKDLRHMPFHLDLCRPFAAHCIGYPVVTLGFGFKSYVSYRIRQKRQKDVRKMNSFYMNLLEEALPIEDVQKLNAQPSISEKGKVHESSSSNGSVYNLMNGSTKISHRKSLDKGEHYANGSAHTEIEPIEKIKECDEPIVEPEKEKTSKPKNKSGQNRENASQRERRNRSNKDHTPNDSSHNRDEYFQRLETDVRRLRSELQSSRQGEQELRSQLSELTSVEKSARAEITLLNHQKDELQSKVQGLSNQRHNDRQSMSSLERKLGEERRLRCNAEAQLALERKNAKRAANSGECSELCKSRRRDLETEVKQLRRELKLKEEQCASTDRELQSLMQYKDSQADTERLLAAVTALQEKNSHLENSLSAENRIKLDLFSALGETRRHLEIRDSLIRVKEREIEELKAKMAQVLAVMPSAELAGALNAVSHSKLRGLVIDGQTSTLDPNASVYTPKQGHLTTEA